MMQRAKSKLLIALLLILQCAQGLGSAPGADFSGDVQAAVKAARAARARFDYSGALRLLDEASMSDPNSPELVAEYGMVYLAAEEPSRAVRYFESALKLDPSCAVAIIGRAGVELLERDYTGAESRLRNHIGDPHWRSSDISSAHAMLARVLLEAGRPKDAANEAMRAIALNPSDADAFYILAYVKAAERKPDEVRALARRALAFDPYNSGARRLLAQYLNGRSGYDQKVSPSVRRRYERGRALKSEGRLAEAASEFEAVLKEQPRDYRTLIALGDTLLREGEYERAAKVAQLAIEVDPDGALGHLELSHAYSGMREKARIKIGGTDFAALFYSQPAPAIDPRVQEVFPDYNSLTERQKFVIDISVAPLAAFLPKLARSGARYWLLPLDQQASDMSELGRMRAASTFDGRYYASIRGVGGKITVSGMEYLETAANGGFNTIAHEFAHQVHTAAMDKRDRKTIHKLYERALRKGSVLDFYAAADEFEYFAQGYEAFVSHYKRPAAGLTARHTRHELSMRDPELYGFLLELSKRSRAARQVLSAANKQADQATDRRVVKRQWRAVPPVKKQTSR
jgi:tetratricopeptide (TPR) repeat protein